MDSDSKQSTIIKKYIGLVAAIIGIAVLAYSIYYQVETEESVLEYIVVVLGLNLSGVMYHIRTNMKKKSN